MDRYDPRWADDRDSDRSADRDWGGRSGRDAEHTPGHEARGPFARHLDLPHGDARERVQSRRRDYDLDGADVDALATIGAFRVVQEADLRDGVEAGHTRARISRLQDADLLDRIPLDGPGRDVVVLTDRGRDLLDGHRLPRDDARSQTPPPEIALVPPNLSCFSISSTLPAPISWAQSAAVMPPLPEPTTSTSTA